MEVIKFKKLSTSNLNNDKESKFYLMVATTIKKTNTLGEFIVEGTGILQVSEHTENMLALKAGDVLDIKVIHTGRFLPDTNIEALVLA